MTKAVWSTGAPAEHCLRWDVKMARRFNDEHRLIYRVRGGDLEIAACHGHYLDK